MARTVLEELIARLDTTLTFPEETKEFSFCSTRVEVKELLKTLKDLPKEPTS